MESSDISQETVDSAPWFALIPSGDNASFDPPVCSLQIGCLRSLSPRNHPKHHWARLLHDLSLVILYASRQAAIMPAASIGCWSKRAFWPDRGYHPLQPTGSK